MTSPSMGNLLITLCTISLLGGLSVSIVGGWAIYIKAQSLEELYPNAESELTFEHHYTSKKIWIQMKESWKNVQSRDLAMIGVATVAGLVQFIIAVILMCSGLQTSSKTIATRYILANLAVFFSILLCNITTISKDNMNVLDLPSDLVKALGIAQHSPFMAVLVFGINAFNIWISLDLIFLFISIIITSCLLRNMKIQEIVIISGV